MIVPLSKPFEDYPRQIRIVAELIDSAIEAKVRPLEKQIKQLEVRLRKLVIDHERFCHD